MAIEANRNKWGNTDALSMTQVDKSIANTSEKPNVGLVEHISREVEDVK